MRQAKNDSEIPGTVAYEAARADRLQARIEVLEAALREIAGRSWHPANVRLRRHRPRRPHAARVVTKSPVVEKTS